MIWLAGNHQFEFSNVTLKEHIEGTQFLGGNLTASATVSFPGTSLTIVSLYFLWTAILYSLLKHHEEELDSCYAQSDLWTLSRRWERHPGNSLSKNTSRIIIFGQPVRLRIAGWWLIGLAMRRSRCGTTRYDAESHEYYQRVRLGV